MREQVAQESIAVECVTDPVLFRSLRGEWQDLFARFPQVTPFNSWDWLFSWWQAYGAERRLRILLVRIDGTLAGIAPLCVGWEKSTLRTPCRVMRFVGDGSFDSDHLDFLIDPSQESAVMRQFEDWLRRSRDWDVLALREITGGSRSDAALRDLAKRLGSRFRTEESVCAVLDLPSSYEEFLQARQSRFRTKVRSLTRKIDQGDIALETQCGPAGLRKKLRSLFDLHQRRWNAAGQPGVFGPRAKRLFYAHFVPRFARNGWLRLYSLRRGQEYVAHQLCFGVAGTTYLLQEGFDVSDPAASFGQMLRAAVVRQLIESGETRYDFLGGFSSHKEDWGARPGKVTHVVAARRNVRALLYFNAPAWRERIAAKARRMLPEPVLKRLRRAGTA
ncbi:MAG TPA: GNAT family N-acetyltransferase [Casimicrobiaceae bacterium]|nr:GNAT family N-acetyltransferase [Casimicrobiaceae bacterium]